MKLPVLLQAAFCFALITGIAVAAESAVPGGPPAKGKSGPPGKVKGPRAGFWDGTLNNAATFNNRGIPSWRHETLVSRKVNFKGAPETEVGYTIYLPPDYATSGARYPVLFFLHGLGGNENTVGPAVETAHALIAKRELPPFIIVSVAGGRSFYGNQFEGKFQMHDFFFEEFIPQIDRTYRTKAERASRHIEGFSMGGYGALMYALKHPDVFGAATDIGGALGAARSNYWKEMYDANEAHYAPFDLHKLTAQEIERLKKDLPIAIWIGSEDIVRQANVQYHALLTEKGVTHSYNDWNNRPQLRGVGHQLPRYFELYGKEILQFHTDRFKR